LYFRLAERFCFVRKPLRPIFFSVGVLVVVGEDDKGLQAVGSVAGLVTSRERFFPDKSRQVVGLLGHRVSSEKGHLEN
jgi:hypothetical protein